MKLKINKTFIKWPKPKIKNKNNKNWNWNSNNQEGQAIIFRGGEREEGKKEIHQHQTRPSSMMCSALIKKGHGDAFNNAHEEYIIFLLSLLCFRLQDEHRPMVLKYKRLTVNSQSQSLIAHKLIILNVLVDEPIFY
jgi:hypothetical protein